jgi:deoxycytidylate deaminase
LSWLRLAIKIAATSDCRVKHGCVIVSRGRVLSTGRNRFRNHPKFIHDYDNCSLHAEVAAIKICRSPFKNATLYVARSTGGLSKPCKRCQEVIETVGIKKVIWTENLN